MSAAGALALTALAFSPDTRTRESSRQAFDVERAVAWLGAQTPAPSASESALVDAALAARALATRSVEANQAARRAFASTLLGAQRSDGSIAGSLPLSWLAAGALDAEDAAAAERLRAFLERPPAPSAAAGSDAGSQSLRRARDFLRTARSDTARVALDPDARELFTLAGGPFDVRRAYSDLLAPDASFADAARDANARALVGAPLYELALAAAVLDHYRTSKEAALLGEMTRPAAQFVRELDARWNASAGAWSDAPGGAPSLRATACGVLAADIVSRWRDTGAPPDLDAARASYGGADASRATCEGCHESLHPSLVAQWRASRHKREGVGCAECHGENHSKVFRESGRVSVEVCGGCHAARVAEFAKSRHAHAEATLLASPLFATTPTAERATCIACHRIGERGTGAAAGNCNYCHPGHAFSSAQAREPEACTVCHTGADYPQDDAYRLSKHGALHATTSDEHTAPTCATCHQPDGRHDDGFGITLGGSGTGAVLAGTDQPFAMRAIDASVFAEHRAAMVAVCARCHSSRLAEQSLREADALKRDGEALLREGASLLRDAHAHGLLGGASDAPLVLGSEQLRPDPSAPGAAALDRYYDMWRFHFAASWKGAYHQSPSIANQRSRPGLRDELELLKAEIARLRPTGEQR